MKPVYFPIINATVTHLHQGTIAKLGIKKAFMSVRLLDNHMNDAILAKVFSVPVASLHTLEI